MSGPPRSERIVGAGQKARRLLVILVGNIALVCLSMLAIEGCASYLLVAREFMRQQQDLAERRHTTYDPDLGWVNEPNVYIRDMYGPGVYLRTNGQRFRSNRNFSTAVPEGSYRIVASGDSYTLGYGVDNDHTWVELLSDFDARIETINMGQAGYGFDQAYLWYKRDAGRFRHQLHLMAFISDDFSRMRTRTFDGYGKPVLTFSGGSLVVTNVPVPRPTSIRRWSGVLFKELGLLRTLDLAQRIGRRLRMVGSGLRTTDAEGWRTVRGVLEDLKRLNEERSSRLILIYIPTLPELANDRLRDETGGIGDEARRLGIPLVDLWKRFRALSPEALATLFIPRGQINYRGSEGHLNERGNAFVAGLVHTELQAIGALPDGR